MIETIKEAVKAITFTITCFIVGCYLIVGGFVAIGGLAMVIHDSPLTRDSCADPDWADLHSDIVKEAYRAGNSIKYVWDAR